MCNMCEYQSSCAPKLARKCEIEHWLPCGADGRAGGRCTVTWLPNFLGWIDLLCHGAPQARFAGQSSAIKEGFSKKIYENFVGTLETVPNGEVSVPTFSSAEAYSVTVMLALCFFSSLFWLTPQFALWLSQFFTASFSIMMLLIFFFFPFPLR